jgi:hypothetical protein
MLEISINLYVEEKAKINTASAMSHIIYVFMALLNTLPPFLFGHY